MGEEFGPVLAASVTIPTTLPSPNVFGGPGSGTTTSATFATLGTTPIAVTLVTGTQVKVTIQGLQTNSSNAFNYLGFAISGATTQAAATTLSLVFESTGVATETLGASSAVFPQTITAGSNTFTLENSTNAGSLATTGAFLIIERLN